MIAQLDRQYVTISPAKSLVRLLTYAFFEGRPLTTRGRWINPVVFGIGRALMHRPARLSVKAPIFIVGQGRSGTTVLGVVLSLHRDIGFLNEPKALWHNVCPYEDLIGNYAVDTGRFVLGIEDATPETVEKFHRLYAGYLRWSRSLRILDKYPEAIYRVPFLSAVFPDARFLLVVRNGNDVCRSISNWSSMHATRNADGLTDWWGKDDRKWYGMIDELVPAEVDLHRNIDILRSLGGQVDRAAVEWILTLRTVRRVREAYPSQSLLVRYEQLLRDPNSTLNDILRFCDLDYDERVFRYANAHLRQPTGASPVKLNEIVKAPFDHTMAEFHYV